MKKVAVVMVSERHRPLLGKATAVLTELGVPVEEFVLAAHRTPQRLDRFARDAAQAGFGVVICAAGLAAHLAGVVAARTVLPVIGVPLSDGALHGMDALLSTVQMPNGYPVATVRLDGAYNAGLLAAQILAIADEQLAARLIEHRRRQQEAAGEQITPRGGANRASFAISFTHPRITLPNGTDSDGQTEP